MKDLPCRFDNLHLDVTSQGLDALKHALHIAWPGNYKATHLLETKLLEKVTFHPLPDPTRCCHNLVEESQGTPTLILFWSQEGGALPAQGETDILPFEFDKTMSARHIVQWLAKANYGPEPDHDGDNQKGFRLFTGDFWGHIAGYRRAICGVQPVWAMYGK
jgi:hypothetical protein